MSLKFKTGPVNIVTYNGKDVKRIKFNEEYVWAKPYTLSISKETGVGSVTVTRTSSFEPTASTGSVSAGSGTIFHGDVLSVSATAASGYNNPTVSFTSGVSNNTVIGDVTVTATAGTLSSTSISITFPGIPTTTHKIYTQVPDGGRIFSASSSTVAYSGYNNYSTCTIDGITVGSTYTTIKTSGSGGAVERAVSLDIGTDTYSARFNNGVLEIYTHTQFVGSSTATSAVLGADSYTTTATFSGQASVTVLDRKPVSGNPSFTNSSAGETITLAGYPQSIDFVLSSGSQTSTYYTWNGRTQQSGYNSIFDYDDLYDYNDSLLRVYYVDYERISSYQGEDQFIDAGIEPIFKLRLKDGYWEQLE